MQGLTFERFVSSGHDRPVVARRDLDCAGVKVAKGTRGLVQSANPHEVEVAFEIGAIGYVLIVDWAAVAWADEPENDAEAPPERDEATMDNGPWKDVSAVAVVVENLRAERDQAVAECSAWLARVEELERVNSKLRAALEVEARFSSEAKAIIEKDRKAQAERHEAKLKMRAALGEDVASEQAVVSTVLAVAARQEEAELDALRAQRDELIKKVEDLEGRLAARDEELRHNFTLAEDWAERLTALNDRLVDAQEANAALTKRAAEDAEQRRRIVALYEAEVARRVDHEAILSAWEEAFKESLNAECKREGCAGCDRSEWTPDEWIANIRDLATRLKSAADVTPLLKRIAEAEEKMNRALELGLKEQRRADHLQVGLDGTHRVQRELEEILTAWEDTFHPRHVWAPPADDERDSGDWTVEEWREAIRATAEHVREDATTARRSTRQMELLLEDYKTAGEVARNQLTEARGVIKHLQAWLEEMFNERRKADVEAELNRPARG